MPQVPMPQVPMPQVPMLQKILALLEPLATPPQLPPAPRFYRSAPPIAASRITVVLSSTEKAQPPETTGPTYQCLPWPHNWGKARLDRHPGMPHSIAPPPGNTPLPGGSVLLWSPVGKYEDIEVHCNKDVYLVHV